MYLEPRLYVAGAPCGLRNLERGVWGGAGEQLCISIADPPLGLPVLCRPDYTPAPGEGEGEEGGYGQQSCVVQHLLYPGDEGRAASAERLCV